MNIPSLFIIIIIFIIWLQYEIRKSKRLSEKGNEDYWKLENQANLTRRSDISNLDYLTIPIDTLPMSDHEDASVNSYRDTIRKLSERKILNLTGITNTELKLKYGAANINLLSEYDNNYTTLVSTLQRWGERLNSSGFVSEAVTVLEYAVSCQSDVSKTYKLLATIYMEQGTPEKIDRLIQVLSDIKMLRKDTVIEDLNKMRSL
jgi:hypothetical protein